VTGDNGRTHEPSLRELTAELDGTREFLLSKIESLSTVIDERDHRYEDRFKAMDEKTGLALTSSKEAVAKAETATEKRFDAVNEFRGTLSDQAANLLPRAEAGAKFSSYDEKFDDMKKEIASLRESRSTVTGEKMAAQTQQVQHNWSMGVVLSFTIGVIGTLLAATALIMRAMGK
jgi:chromosome segregation ATPase